MLKCFYNLYVLKTDTGFPIRNKVFNEERHRTILLSTKLSLESVECTFWINRSLLTVRNVSGQIEKNGPTVKLRGTLFYYPIELKLQDFFLKLIDIILGARQEKFKCLPIRTTLNCIFYIHFLFCRYWIISMYCHFSIFYSLPKYTKPSSL